MKALCFGISFLLAFLLFSLQPMTTKMVLPVLGGTPAVWNTAMVCFQILLLFGYAYAHILKVHIAINMQWKLHALMVIASLAVLPISIELSNASGEMQSPIWRLASAFVLQVGLPFFVLSATAPLLQSWVSRSQHTLKDTPYVLYSASNLGSIFGLLGYVACIEPNFSLYEQSAGWSILFIVGTMLLVFIGWRLVPNIAKVVSNAKELTANTVNSGRIAFWILLAFLPSALSLGLTSYIATDIASVPLLWVIPFSIYLLSFVDAFRTRPLLVPIFQQIAPILGCIAVGLYFTFGASQPLFFLAHIIAFAAIAFALHGNLAQSKPATSDLTLFYFSLSIGGALGGIFITLVAPNIFSTSAEYPLVLIGAILASLLLRFQSSFSIFSQLKSLLRIACIVALLTAILYGVFFVILGKGYFLYALVAAGLVVLIAERNLQRAYYTLVVVYTAKLLFPTPELSNSILLERERNFFGVQKVYEQSDNTHVLLHNTTLHGLQSLDESFRLTPTTYYWGLKEPMTSLPIIAKHPIGAVGLGVGTVKCYTRKGQQIDFFEINPLNTKIAEDPRYFTYLRDCAGNHTLFVGDGRILLSQQADERYGVLIIDAFSSDSIPVHLLTREAMLLYQNKLVDGGVLLIHITNRHLYLMPLLASQAKSAGLIAYMKEFDPSKEDAKLRNSSDWVILARNEEDIAPLLKEYTGWKKLVADDAYRAWTDDYSNILPYLKILQ